jgi:DNA gyrase subunit B
MPEIIKSGHLYHRPAAALQGQQGPSEVYVKDQPALDRLPGRGGLQGRVLESRGGARSGARSRGLVEHALRMKALMASCRASTDPVSRRWRLPARSIRTSRPRTARRRCSVAAKHLQPAIPTPSWSASSPTTGGDHVPAQWRGVTDAHHRSRQASSLAPRRASCTSWRRSRPKPIAAPARLVKQRRAGARARPVPAAEEEEVAEEASRRLVRRGDHPAEPAARRGPRRGPQGPRRSALQGPRRDERRAAVGEPRSIRDNR